MNIQLIGAIAKNPKYKEHFEFASRLVEDAFKRINITDISIINPAYFDNPNYLEPIKKLKDAFFGATNEKHTEISIDACALIFSIFNLLFKTDMICVLPNISQSLGAGAEIMMARRKKIPPIFIMSVDKQNLKELLEIYFASKQGVPEIDLVYDTLHDRLMLSKYSPQHAISISKLIDGKTVDEILAEKYLFIYEPSNISFIFHWELKDMFDEPNQQPNINLQ